YCLPKENENLLHRLNHYFPIYHRHFRHLQNKNMRILEIGINQGGSVLMWLNYFGPNCMYYGVDINPECKKLEKINDKKNVQIFIGDQADQTFLAYFIIQISKIDV